MADREPFSGADNAWRRMGSWNNLMAITGVMSFEETVGYEQLCDRLEDRLLRFDRFSQRVVGGDWPFGRPRWESVEEFDVRSHVYRVALPEPGDKATFERFVGTLMSRPLDERQPLWEMYLMDDAGAGDGNALVFRLNHSIGDGFALLYVLLGVVDDPEGIEFPLGAVSAPPPPDDGGDASDGHARATDGAGPDAADGTETPTEPASRGPDTPATDSTSLRSRARGALRGVVAAARAGKVGYDLLTMPAEPETSLRGDLGATKRAAWTDTVDLAVIKAIGEAHDATVNDVLLAATAGALRRHLDGRGEQTEGLVLRCTVPVNLAPMADRAGSLGNHFGLAFVELPVGTRDLDDRIAFVRERTDRRRLGVEAFLVYQVLRAAGRTPEAAQRWAMGLFEDTATGIVTNVPGPLDSVEILGSEVSDITFWVPQANDQGLGVSIFSYDGGVRVGVAGDANLLADPGSLTDAFEAEVEALLADLPDAAVADRDVSGD